MAEKKKKQSGPELHYKPVSAWEGLAESQVSAIIRWNEGYKRFLAAAKTERECVEAIEARLKREHFRPIANCDKLKAGDRVYKAVKGRALAAAVIGNAKQTWRLVGSHVDSPRLDLKPNPLFEDADLAMLQTHYYGGIKKYHWVNVPLSLHARVTTRQGEKKIVIGEAAHEPRFLIPDIPPHLAREQMGKNARDAVSGEQMRVVVGNRPVSDKEEKEKVKLAVLHYLHREYGLVERDLLYADISLVPAAEPVDVGLDRAMIAAYGQDDRACVYGTLDALAGLDRAKGVALALFVDKEETGSQGDTGAQSRLLENFAAEVRRKLGLSETAAEILERATAISGDVTEALNPNFRDVSDGRNSSRLGGGVSVEKYGGSGGKYGTHDCATEFMGWLVRLMDDAKIPWQTGEMGKLDLGGGGTIAQFLSYYGMDAIDAGPPLLSMHSTQELSSKVDVHAAYRLYQAFLKS